MRFRLPLSSLRQAKFGIAAKCANECISYHDVSLYRIVMYGL